MIPLGVLGFVKSALGMRVPAWIAVIAFFIGGIAAGSAARTAQQRSLDNALRQAEVSNALAQAAIDRADSVEVIADSARLESDSLSRYAREVASAADEQRVEPTVEVEARAYESIEDLPLPVQDVVRPVLDDLILAHETVVGQWRVERDARMALERAHSAMTANRDHWFAVAAQRDTALANKQMTVDALELAYAHATRPDPWYRNRYVIAGAGVIAGIVIDRKWGAR